MLQALHKIDRSQFSSIRFLELVMQQLQQYHQWRQPWWFPLLHPLQLVINTAGSSSATANVLAR